MRRCSAESILQSRRSLFGAFSSYIAEHLCVRKSSQCLRSLVVFWGSTALGAWRIPIAAGSGTCRYISTFRCGFLSGTLPVTSVGTLLFSLCVRVQLPCYPSIPRCLEILRGMSLGEFSRGFFQPVGMSDVCLSASMTSLFPAFTFHFICGLLPTSTLCPSSSCSPVADSL